MQVFPCPTLVSYDEFSVSWVLESWSWAEFVQRGQKGGVAGMGGERVHVRAPFSSCLFLNTDFSIFWPIYPCTVTRFFLPVWFGLSAQERPSSPVPVPVTTPWSISVFSEILGFELISGLSNVCIRTDECTVFHELVSWTWYTLEVNNRKAFIDNQDLVPPELCLYTHRPTGRCLYMKSITRKNARTCTHAHERTQARSGHRRMHAAFSEQLPRHDAL